MFSPQPFSDLTNDSIKYSACPNLSKTILPRRRKRRRDHCLKGNTNNMRTPLVTLKISRKTFLYYACPVDVIIQETIRDNVHLEEDFIVLFRSIRETDKYLENQLNRQRNKIGDQESLGKIKKRILEYAAQKHIILCQIPKNISLSFEKLESSNQSMSIKSKAYSVNQKGECQNYLKWVRDHASQLEETCADGWITENGRIILHDSKEKLKLIDDDKKLGISQQFLTDMFNSMAMKTSC